GGQACPVPDLHYLARLGAPHAQVMRLVVTQGYQGTRYCGAGLDEHSHARRAATAHQPVSVTSSTIAKPDRASSGRKSSASGSSIPEKTAMPPGPSAAAIAGRRATFTLRRMLER